MTLNTFLNQDKVICLRIKKGDVVLLFNLLHSLLCNAVIKELEIPQEKSTFINMIFRILEDNLIEKIGVFSEKIDLWVSEFESHEKISSFFTVFFYNHRNARLCKILCGAFRIDFKKYLQTFFSAVWLGFVEKVKPISFQCHLRSITKGN